MFLPTLPPPPAPRLAVRMARVAASEALFAVVSLAQSGEDRAPVPGLLPCPSSQLKANRRQMHALGAGRVEAEKQPHLVC